jgi:RNA polymerase sigma-70 factor (ECF subfamily)
LLRVLPPQERAAIVLKDVFEFSLHDVAAILGTTEGAVKSALHRARATLSLQHETATQPVELESVPSPALVDRFVDAFNQRNVDAVVELLLADADVEVVGMCQEYTRDTARKGSITHTILDANAPRAERTSYLGEQIVLLWYSVTEDGKGTEYVQDVLRFEEIEGQIGRLRYYYFCPETLTEIARSLNVPVRPIGYRFPVAGA